MNDLSKYIRSIPDFPKKGILFRDITTLLKDPDAFKETIGILHKRYSDSKIDKVVCIESRGFIVGSALALSLGAGFIPIRKKGKLPAEVVSEQYSLEYGVDTIEIHRDAIQPGDRVLLHDDLLATGGTIAASIRLLEKLQAKIIGVSFIIELIPLHGRNKIKDYDVFSIIQYDSD
jgi:adenine phosphoribosyltransferase